MPIGDRDSVLPTKGCYEESLLWTLLGQLKAF